MMRFFRYLSTVRTRLPDGPSLQDFIQSSIDKNGAIESSVSNIATTSHDIAKKRVYLEVNFHLCGLFAYLSFYIGIRLSGTSRNIA